MFSNLQWNVKGTQLLILKTAMAHFQVYFLACLAKFDNQFSVLLLLIYV